MPPRFSHNGGLACGRRQSRIKMPISDRLADGADAQAVAEFAFYDPAGLSASIPEDTLSRLEIVDGRLVLMDSDLALIGAELDLPEDLGPHYRIRWRQAMSEDCYSGLMVFVPGDFEFDLYNHKSVTILHVGTNQGESAP